MNSLFLTYCPSLRDCPTKRGDKSLQCREETTTWLQKPQRWKLCGILCWDAHMLVWFLVCSRLHLSQKPSSPLKPTSTSPTEFTGSESAIDRPYLPFNKPHPPLLYYYLLPCSPIIAPLIFPSLLFPFVPSFLCSLLPSLFLQLISCPSPVPPLLLSPRLDSHYFFCFLSMSPVANLQGVSEP